MPPLSILTLVLNLKHRTDRRRAIEARLARVGLEPVFVEAINGRAPELSDTIQPIVSRTGLNPGEVGCYLSHIKAWQYLLASEHNEALILEDDSLVDPALPLVLRELQSQAEALRVVRLSASHKLVGHSVRQLTPESCLICPTKNPSSTIGYFLTKAGAAMLLGALSEIRHAVDKEFDNYWVWGGDILTLKPSVVFHEGVTSSDIGGVVRRASRAQAKNWLGKIRHSLIKRAMTRYVAMTHPLKTNSFVRKSTASVRPVAHSLSKSATWPSSQKKQVILFLTHQWNPSIAARYRQLHDSVVDQFDVRILLDVAEPRVKALCLDSLGLEAYAEQVIPFSAESLPRNLGFPLFRRGRIVPGSAHFPVLAFGLLACYEYYWVVEYDVLIQGGWPNFLQIFDDSHADLVCTHLSTKKESPDWVWWKRYDVPRRHAEFVRQHEADIPKAFFPLYRISDRALKQVVSAHRAGLKAHFEVALPMALWLEGMSIQDMAEVGPLYTTGSLGGERAPQPYSTFRWRPAITTEELLGAPKSMIYHPVKEADVSRPERS